MASLDSLSLLIAIDQMWFFSFQWWNNESHEDKLLYQVTSYHTILRMIYK